MPEVIDGVTYPTTTGGRPYPTAASPGKALWQLLQRAMTVIDALETDVNARIAALAAQISSSAPIVRMLWMKNNIQIPGFTTDPIVLPWTPDTLSGDPTTAARLAQLPLSDSDRRLTVTVPGLYEIKVNFGNRTMNFGIRKNGTTLLATRQTSTDGVVTLAQLVANDYIEILAQYAGSSDTYTYSGKTEYNPAGGSANVLRDSYRYQLQIVRLGS